MTLPGPTVVAGGAPTGPQIGLARGTLLVTCAEALAFPAGLVTTVLLTRHLPASEYGALALGLAAVAWLEWTVASFFSRAAFKLIAEPDGGDAVAAAVVRTYLGTGLVVGLLVFAGAGRVADLFGVPALTAVLRILSVEIPLFAAAQAYRAILVGRGQHAARASVAAARWTVRALLIAAGVIVGLPLTGLAGLFVAATAVEMILMWWRVGPGLRGAPVTHVSVRRLVSFAAPLAASAVCMRLFDRMDLFAVRLLGSSLETVAAYGVAQNLALAPGLLGGAFVPGLIAALSYHFVAGDLAGAHRTTRDAFRVGLLVLPLMGLAAGAAPVLVETLFGTAYAASAQPFSALVIGAVGMLILSLASGVLVAAGHPRWTVVVTAPMLPLAALGHIMVIPRAGAPGAALVTACVALTAAAAACFTAYRLVESPFPLATLVRTALLGAGGFWAGARLLPGPGPSGLLGVCVLGVLMVAILLATELSRAERDRARGGLVGALRALRGSGA